MSTDKTPLHAVVSVICDCLSSLSADDQTRALEAARVSLGLQPVVPPPPPRRARAQPAPVPTGYQEVPALPALPVVQVEMMSGAPMVLNQPLQRQGRATVLIGPQQSGRPLRQLTAWQVPTLPESAQSGGYVRTARQFR
jgi:hypothetical protein